MDIVNKFNNIIIEESKKYDYEEEMSYNQFYDLYYFDPNYDLKIQIYDEDKRLYINFDNTIDAFEYLDEQVDDLTIVLKYNVFNNLEIFVMQMKEILKSNNIFSDIELGDLLDNLADYFYAVYSNVEEFIGKEDIEEYLKIIEDYKSNKCNLVEIFMEDEEFCYTILTEYCDEIIRDNMFKEEQREEIEEDITDNEILDINNINDFTRKKMIGIVDYLVEIGYSDEEYYKYFASYLTHNISFKRMSPSLFRALFDEDEIREKNLKNYMIYLALYDYYTDASFDKDKNDTEVLYCKIIEQYNLNDLYKMFIDDYAFRLQIIKRFVDSNLFIEEKRPNKIADNIFKPISTIDNLLTRKIK